jgi:prepilin-type N-terminal cleavage/methylation domain-containing protein
MLKALGDTRPKGFTLIELMIVIGIIGLLAAIAIPNFIRYRDKGFCSAGETDAESIAAAIGAYYTIPQRTAMVTFADLNIVLSGTNTATVGGTIDAMTITVTDTSGRCPTDYQASQPNWDGSNVFQLVIN